MIFTTDIIIAMSPEEQQLALTRFLVILQGFSQELASVRAQTSIECGPNEHTLLCFYIQEARLKLDDIGIITKAAETIVRHSRNMAADQRSAFLALIGGSPNLNNSGLNAPVTVLSPADALATLLSPKDAPVYISVPTPSCENADAPVTIMSRQKELQEAVKDFEELLARM